VQIKKLPEKLRDKLNPDDVAFLTNLDLLNCNDYDKFTRWLQSKNVEEDKLKLAETKRLNRDRWATLQEIADDLNLTILSVRRAINICFFYWNKKPLKDYSEVSMLSNMDVNLSKWREKGKNVLKPENEEKMREFARKYYYSHTNNRWYYRTTTNE
jgi:hypothetical protein